MLDRWTLQSKSKSLGDQSPVDRRESTAVAQVLLHQPHSPSNQRIGRVAVPDAREDVLFILGKIIG
jgi:hypothetical protein